MGIKWKNLEYQKRKPECIKMYKKGITTSKIAHILSIAEGTVSVWAHKAGLISRRKSQNEKKKALELYGQGLSLWEIANILKLGVATVSRWVKFAGISRLPSQANKGRYGELAFGWKGGRTSDRLIDMGRQEYKDWRLAVFMRDNFRCVSCSCVGGRLHAHHILGYAKYPKQRYNIENGITLCISCHCAIHRKSIMGKYRREGA